MDKRIDRRHKKLTSVEWPTAWLILACYGTWALAGTLVWSFSPFVALALLTLTIALHSSLVHEATHGHPTRIGIVNEILVGLPVGLVYPYRRFKMIHLSHHADERLTDPFDDPESYYHALWQYRELPSWMRVLLKVNNTMVGRFAIGPAISTIGFIVTDFRLLIAGERPVRRAWLHHMFGLAVMLPIVIFIFEPSFWMYLVPVYFGQSIIAIRTFAEHQWSERPDGRTIIVEKSLFFSFLFLNNNLHLVHHKMPTVAWYKLPALFRERRAQWVTMNDGYVYPSYLAMLKDYAFKAKEPVVHPVLRRVPEPGRTLRPHIDKSTGHVGLGFNTIPAEPPKE